MKKNAKGLIAHCKTALENNVQYIYGAKMQVLSLSQIKALQNTYGKGFVWEGDLKKAGKLCCDCSGLISSYTGVTRNSAAYKASAEAYAGIADVKKNWEKYVGWAFWLSGHIGVVSDKKGYYYAMDGSARNMVHYPISKQNWVYALKLCDIDYGGDEEVIEKIKINVEGKLYEVHRILKDGSNYVKLADFGKMGFAVGYDEKTKIPSLKEVK